MKMSLLFISQFAFIIAIISCFMCSIDIDSHQLPLIANLLEEVVAKQLIAVLDKHSLFDKFQSSFPNFCSSLCVN